jgi:hypothetical protein
MKRRQGPAANTNAFTKNFVSKVMFSRLSDAPDISSLRGDTSEAHRYCMVIYDLCMESVFEAKRVSAEESVKMTSTRLGMEKFLVTGGTRLQKRYNKQDSEGWTLGMFVFLSMATLYVVSTNDFISEKAMLNRELEEIDEGSPQGGGPEYRSLGKTAQRLRRSLAAKKSAMKEAVIKKMEGAMALDEKDDVFVETGHAVTPETLMVVRRQGIVYSVEKKIADMGVSELYGSIKCITVKWRFLKVTRGPVSDSLRAYLDAHMYHASFMMTGCVRRRHMDDEYHAYTNPEGRGPPGGEVYKFSNSHIAYLWGAFSFMWRSLYIVENMRPSPQVTTHMAAVTGETRERYARWVDAYIDGISGKDRLRNDVYGAILWQEVRPGEVEHYSYTEHADISNIKAPISMFHKTRPDSEYTYFASRLKDVPVEKYTTSRVAWYRDVVVRKAMGLYFTNGYKLEWERVAYVDEADYHMCASMRMIHPVILKCCGTYYVCTGYMEGCPHPDFSSAFLTWLRVMGCGPRKGVMKSAGVDVDLSGLLAEAEMWGYSGGEEASRMEVDAEEGAETPGYLRSKDFFL